MASKDLMNALNQNNNDFVGDIGDSIEKTNKKKPQPEKASEDDELGFDPKHPKAAVSFSFTKNLFDDIFSSYEATKREPTGTLSGVQDKNMPSQQKLTNNKSDGDDRSLIELFSREQDLKMTTPQEKNGHHQTLNNSDRRVRNQPQKSIKMDWLGIYSTEPKDEEEPFRKTLSAHGSLETEVKNRPERESVDGRKKLMQKSSKQKVIFTDDTDASLLSSDNKPKVESSDILLRSENHDQSTEETSVFTHIRNFQIQEMEMMTRIKEQELKLLELKRDHAVLLHQQQLKSQTYRVEMPAQHTRQENSPRDYVEQQTGSNSMAEEELVSPISIPELNIQHSSTSVDDLARSSANNLTYSVPSAHSKQSDYMLHSLKLDAENKRLTIDNERLEDLINSNQNRYEQEIEYIKRFYKKQIEVLEEQLVVLEQRLKGENEATELHYQKRIDAILRENEEKCQATDEQIDQLKRKHEQEFEQMRLGQIRDLEMIKEEHKQTLDAIRQAKMQELQALKESSMYMNMLQATSSNLENLSGDIQDLQQNMQGRIESMLDERQRKLEEREQRIQESENRLKDLEESNGREKERLLELIGSLEAQMQQLRRETSEENWELRKKLAIFEGEKLSFAKEKEHFREQMLRDEERIKEMKDKELQEMQQMQQQLQEDRNRLSAERSQFQVEKRLHTNATDVEKERLELEAAIETAQEANRKADQERERYYKMLRRLEQQKRELDEREQTTLSLHDDLQQEIISYRTAVRNTQEEQQRYRMSEQLNREQKDALQQRKKELDEKEIEVSMERLLVSEERISVQNLRRQVNRAQEREWANIRNAASSTVFCSRCIRRQVQLQIQQQQQQQQQQQPQQQQLQYQNLLDESNAALAAAIATSNNNNNGGGGVLPLTVSSARHNDPPRYLHNRLDINNNRVLGEEIDNNGNALANLNMAMNISAPGNNPVENVLDQELATSLRRMNNPNHYNYNNLGNWTPRRNIDEGEVGEPRTLELLIRSDDNQDIDYSHVNAAAPNNNGAVAAAVAAAATLTTYDAFNSVIRNADYNDLGGYGADDESTDDETDVESQRSSGRYKFDQEEEQQQQLTPTVNNENELVQEANDETEHDLSEEDEEERSDEIDVDNDFDREI